MNSVLRVLQPPSLRQRCGSVGGTLAVDSLSMEMPQLGAGAHSCAARGNFTLRLPGRKAGLNAAKPMGDRRHLKHPSQIRGKVCAAGLQVEERGEEE